jgi:hypothetical protein
MARNNKQIFLEINEPSSPEYGTRLPAGKSDGVSAPAWGTDVTKLSPTDESAPAFKYRFGSNAVTTAKEETGVVEKCLDQQLGRKEFGEGNGGRLGNATNQPSSSVNWKGIGQEE